MFQQLPQRQIPLRGTPLNQGRCWLSDDRYVPFFLSLSIIYVYATLSAQTTLLYSHIRFSTPRMPCVHSLLCSLIRATVLSFEHLYLSLRILCRVSLIMS